MHVLFSNNHPQFFDVVSKYDNKYGTNKIMLESENNIIYSL